MACFHFNTIEKFIFLLKHCQRKVDLNTSKKSCFRYSATLKISSFHPIIIYKNFIFTQKKAFAKRCCFLTFLFEGKLRKYDISVKRKHTKTNENMVFSALFFHVVLFIFFDGNIYISSPVRYSYLSILSDDQLYH